MKKFLVTYHAPQSAIDQMSTATPEQIAAATQPWMAWYAANKDYIVDFGSRLFSGEQKSEETAWKPASNEVTGFSILQASSLSEIQDRLKTHPQLAWDSDCRISIHEFQSM